MDSGSIGRWSRSRNFYVSLREESWPVRLTSPKRPTSLEYRESRIYLGIKKKKGNGRIERFHGSKVRDITKSSNAVISIVAVCVRIRRSVAPTRLITRPAKIFSKSLPVTVSVVVTVNAVTKNSFGFRTVRGTCVVIQPMISGSRRTHS